MKKIKFYIYNVMGLIKYATLFLFYFYLPVLLLAENKPLLGAQVYIEPGQSPKEIEHYFKLMKNHGMQVCRIRMDESHMRDGTGGYDFSLYRRAFDEAAKNGVAVFATIFPANVLSDANSASGVGGFKFPESEAHLESIRKYISALVNYFKNHPALKVWVLQNEPGVAGNMPDNDFARNRFAHWKRAREPRTLYNEYMQIHYDQEAFMRDYTTWYLQWLANEVRQYDPIHELHVNPHMIFSNLADYDFPQWQQFLSHVGASMHPSWHFGSFGRNEYPLAMAANCEIIRGGASPLPFWITELQGGNNNFSGYNPLLPSRSEIAQWMWTGLASGARGIIFWTLNPRAAGFEAGEWSLVDFKGEPTERLQMASEIARVVDEVDELDHIEPLLDRVYLLYSPESMVLQRHSVITSPEVNESFLAREEGAHVKSLLAYYRVFQENGVNAQIFNMHQFNWLDNPEGKTVVLPNMAIIPRQFYSKLEAFVSNGGRLLVSGQSGHFDEVVYNVMYGAWPLQKLFGASIREFQALGGRFEVPVGERTLAGHFLQGVIDLQGATALGVNTRGEAIASKYHFGKGEVLWIPSMIGLAAWEKTEQPFVDFLLTYCKTSSVAKPVLYAKKNQRGVLVKHFNSSKASFSLLINKSNQKQVFKWESPQSLGRIVFSLNKPCIKHNQISLANDDCVVIQWAK